MSSAPASVASPVRREQPEPPSSEQLAEASGPYSEACIAAFGAERRMFESTFPVDKESFSYAVYWNARKRQARGAHRRQPGSLLPDRAAEGRTAHPARSTGFMPDTVSQHRDAAISAYHSVAVSLSASATLPGQRPIFPLTARLIL
jgi:hypothetical protein